MTAYSPTLSLLTAGIELSVAAWALSGPGRTRITRPTAALLILLAGYQLIEVFVCATPSNVFLARAAFANVIWLPPLAVYLITLLSKPKHPILARLPLVMFATAGGFAIWVFVDPTAVVGTVCHAVVATYDNQSSVYDLYAWFYQLGLLGMMIGGVSAVLNTENDLDRRHLADITMGTIGFVVPAITTVAVVPAAMGSTPSVMCHYALVLGLFLTRMVARERRAARQEIVTGSAAVSP